MLLLTKKQSNARVKALIKQGYLIKKMKIGKYTAVLKKKKKKKPKKRK